MDEFFFGGHSSRQECPRHTIVKGLLISHLRLKEHYRVLSERC